MNCRLIYGVVGVQSLVFPGAVSKRNEDQGVVDHHARQGHNPKHADNAHAVSHDQMPNHRPNDAKGNTEHDDQRLCVAAERDRQQGINAQQRQEEGQPQTLHAVGNIRSHALESVAESGICFLQSREEILLHVLQHLSRPIPRHGIGRHLHDTSPTPAVNCDVRPSQVRVRHV